MSTFQLSQEWIQSKRSSNQRSWPSTAELRPRDDASDSSISTEARERQRRRNNLQEWQWKGTIFVICLTSMISGYDVSNVTNIQPRLYEALGQIELLEWISLSFSLAIFSVLSLARKIVYCFDLRYLYLVHLIIFIVGSAVAGSAKSISTIIIGRSIMGLAGAVILQANMSYLATFATPAETPGLIACSSASWAIGLAIGGPIGSGMAENVTWRWAFYLNLPLVALALVISLVSVPHLSFVDLNTTVLYRLRHIDPVGIVLNAVVPELFAVAVTFADPIWHWGSAPSIATWLLFSILLVTWILQQYFCIFTTQYERALPLHMLSRSDLLPVWVASACAGSAYAIGLTYTPLFFAFVRGSDAVDQSVRLLPFTLLFIFTILLTGRLLPIVRRYKLVYITAGFVTTLASAMMATSLSRRSTPDSQIMGLGALLGVGLGLHFQHGVGISNVINKYHQRDRIDSVAFCNFAQFGGIAITLAIAGSVYQNVGYKLLSDALDVKSASGHDIREALAGVSSSIWHDVVVQRQAVAAVSDVISREFYLALTAGVLCFGCGITMKSDKLDYKS